MCWTSPNSISHSYRQAPDEQEGGRGGTFGVIGGAETKFAEVNAGWPSRNLFLGRWARSGMGFTGERAWGARTLVVGFDDRGIVKRFHECGDRELLKILPDYLKAQLKKWISDCTGLRDLFCGERTRTSPTIFHSNKFTEAEIPL